MIVVHKSTDCMILSSVRIFFVFSNRTYSQKKATLEREYAQVRLHNVC